MAPVKFDDIQKVAGSILDDDYQTNGYEFSSKQKTNWNSAVATTTVNLFGAKEGVQTPAKIGWKIPAPLGLAGLTVDKLEMDKAGKFKLETSLDKGLHAIDGLKVEVKSDLESVSKITSAVTFTGIADTQIKVDAPVTKPDAFTLDLTRSVQNATLGLKCNMANLTAPDLGARFATGPFFGSVLLKNKFQAVTLHAAYTASSDLKVAATCAKGKDLKGTVGLEYKVSSDTTVKAKVQEDTSVSASVKHSVAKGLTVTAGGKYETKGGKLAYGLKLSVE
jgi:hypothetical protein